VRRLQPAQRAGFKKKVRGTGVDINGEQLTNGLALGLNVYQGNLDEGLSDFPDQAYDYVILNQTLQVVKKPLLVLNEMLRIGRYGIVGFPSRFSQFRALETAHRAFSGRPGSQIAGPAL
jgi:methionine biosynthesis protein MetW